MSQVDPVEYSFATFIEIFFKRIWDNFMGNKMFFNAFQMMSAIKSGYVTYSRFARMAELEEAKHERDKITKVTVDRSGGGL